MLTTRGWWLLFVAAVMAIMGAAVSFARGPFIALLGLSVAFWVQLIGLGFYLSARRTLRKLTVEREWLDARGPVKTLWVGQRFTVVVRLRTPSLFSTPWIIVDDRIPVGAELESGSNYGVFQFRRGDTVEIRYSFRCLTAGPMRFEGLRLRMADAQGFYFYETFYRLPQVILVLPTLADAELSQRNVKRQNVFLPPGVHRLRQPGSGSELLDLRDYRPGDSPKLIAWKVSARKNKLITKEFESDVPIRCTLMVDASSAVRLGPPGRTALARTVEIASTVAQAVLSRRDPVGLLIFDETGSHYLQPSRGQRHMLEILRRLGAIANISPISRPPDLGIVGPLGESLVYEIFPALMDRTVNDFSVWSAIWSPRPEYLRRLTLGDALFPWRRRFSPRAWREERRRKQLAAVLTFAEKLSPGCVALLAEDDQRFADAMQRLLSHYQIPYPIPLLDEKGRHRFLNPERIEIAAKALLRSVRRGRDNELFVLMVHILGLGEHLTPLRQAIRVAVGRRHRVVIIVPWPAEIPFPDTRLDEPAETSDHMVWLRQEAAQWYRREFNELRHDLAHLGVTVVVARTDEALPLVLKRMEQLRVGGIRR
jgi:uncharacterized protein (DUF58 family)